MKLPEDSLDVTVYGEAAWDIIVVINRIPGDDESVIPKKLVERPGGMSLNVSLFLSQYGLRVGFNFKLAGDPYGSKILNRLRSANIKIFPVIEDESETLRTIVLTDCKGFKNTIPLLKPNVALTISNVNEVETSLIEVSRLIYIGGVYLEVARVIGEKASKHNVITVYRPGYPFFQRKPFETMELMPKFNICIMNRPSWKALSNAVGIESPDALLKDRCEAVIVTSKEGPKLYTHTYVSSFKPRFKGGNVIGVGDFFAATLIKKLLDGYTIKRSVEYSAKAAEEYSKMECLSIRIPGLPARSM